MRRPSRPGRRLRLGPVACAYGVAGLLGFAMLLGLAQLAMTPADRIGQPGPVEVLALSTELRAPAGGPSDEAKSAVVAEPEIAIAALPPTLSGLIDLPQPTWSLRIGPPQFEEHLPPAAATIEPAAPPDVMADAPTVTEPLALAKPSPPPLAARGRRPLVNVIIDDMGYSPRSLARLAALPGPLTLSFLPYADATPAMLRTAGRGGFHIFLHLPMEPLGDADPGVKALLADLDETHLKSRVREALAAVPGAEGVNNHMGSRLTAQPEAMRWVMDELRQRPLVFVDSRTNAKSVAEATALGLGVPATGRDVFIDHVPEPEAIARQLQLIERIARHDGSVVAIGHPYDVTLRALEHWLPSLEQRGFRLASVGEVIALRHCGDAALDPWTCRPALQLVGTEPSPLLPLTGAAGP